MQALAVGSGPGVEEDKAGVRWGVCGGAGIGDRQGSHGLCFKEIILVLPCRSFGMVFSKI